jgi:hypothetical protein
MKIKRLCYLIGTMLVIVLLAELTLFVANVRTRRQAESLLASLRALKLGTSTLQDAQQILVTYRAGKIPPSSNCPKADTAYGILIWNHVIYNLALNHPVLLRVGLRPVSVSAALSFVGGRLCEFRYGPGALLLGSQYPLQIGSLRAAPMINIDAETAVQASNTSQESKAEQYDIRYFQTLLRGYPEGGFHLGMRVTVTPSASPLEMQHALSFDLSCFTSFRGCRTFCQMMPLAAQDALRRQRTEGLPIPDVPKSEIDYPACSEAFRPLS